MAPQSEVEFGEVQVRTVPFSPEQWPFTHTEPNAQLLSPVHEVAVHTLLTQVEPIAQLLLVVQLPPTLPGQHTYSYLLPEVAVNSQQPPAAATVVGVPQIALKE